MRFPGVLDRYVMRSVLAPGSLAFLVYTFLMMMRAIFSLIEQIFSQGMPAVDALKIVLASMPHVVVLTIPLSFLFGVLLAVGRMNGDNELVALQAGGVSPRRLLPSILFMALVLTSLNGYLFLKVIPESHTQLRLIKARAFTAATNVGRIEPKVFYEDFPNILLYVQDVDQETGEWENVLLYESGNPKEERLTLAKRGRVVLASQTSPDDGEVPEVNSSSNRNNDPWLILEEVVAHQFLRNKPTTNRLNAIDRQLVKIRTQNEGVRSQTAIRERGTEELVVFLQAGEFSDGDETERTRSADQLANDMRLAEIELHRRFAIPAAAIVFALLGLPLGIGSGAGGKGRGLVVSVMVILVYYIMVNNGEVLALKGQIPVWAGMWVPNLSLAVIGLIMMTKMGSWLGERQARESWLTQGWRRLVDWLEKVKARRRRTTFGELSPLTGSIPIRIQRRRYSARFPTLFDRHLARRFLAPLLLVLVTTVSLYVVVDLSTKLDDIAKNDISTDVVIAFYLNLMPKIVLDVVPMGMMISVLVLLTVLERQRELTALKSAGVSLYRVMLPVLLIAMMGTGFMWFLEEKVLPKANREAKRLLDRIKGRDRTHSLHAGDRLWMVSKDDEGTFYKFFRYDPPTKTLVNFTMFKFDDRMQLQLHLSADRAWYENGRWMTDAGWYRRFSPDGTDEFEKITSRAEIGIPEGPTYFGKEFRRPSEMSFSELQAYIEAIKKSGYRPGRLIVHWHQKLSYPASAFVLVLLALPFGLNRGGHRVSTMQGVGIALGLGIAYLSLVGLLGKMGEANLLPPVAGAWAPVVLTVLFAVNRMSVLRT